MATRKASGRNIRESERNTVAVKLRLAPEAAEDLKSYAEEFGISMSDLASRILTRIGGEGTDELLTLILDDLREERGEDV